jgi:hypothetical protein
VERFNHLGGAIRPKRSRPRISSNVELNDYEIEIHNDKAPKDTGGVGDTSNQICHHSYDPSSTELNEVRSR